MPNQTRILFESYPCHRCGGSGRYCRGVCFRCNGAKRSLTANGRRARAKWMAWREANLTLTPDEALLSGTPVLVPQQFAGPAAGGQYVVFKRAHRVTAVRYPSPDADPCSRWVQVDLAIRLPASPSPWIDYDAERGCLTIRLGVEERLYRQPTNAELRAAAPTLGKGATLTEVAVA